MLISQIIEHADNRTERKVNHDKLSLETELHLLIQELLQENRFWWSKKSGTFSTVVNTATYDLTDTSILSGANSDIAEIIGLFRVDSDGSITEMTPLTEVADQVAAKQATTAAEPSTWMIDHDTYGTVRLGAPASGAYTIRVVFWAGHNFDYSSGGTVDTVPVVPPWLHYGLIIGLEMKIFEFLYGQEDPRYAVAATKWGRFLRQANRKPSFTTQRSRGHGENIEAVTAY